ncbi:DNA polymerase I [Phycisphaerales bacterium AB-hyl4]|uniref:DNA polymerase I n=1 Tax=Natronomicrosphaera hydrolytica TaxID=3242702 RepID=A0ABV4U8X7_9BACT
MPRDTPDNTLYLIDGHAQIFRAYYAIRTSMTSPVTGEPTNAVFAYTGMLLKLFNQFRPHYVAMAIDSPGKTFRDELYEDYKAQREAPPEDFAQQIPRILEITRLFGIPVLGQEGAEADDLIATITQRILDDAGHADVKLRLVSKDKDLEQLLGDRVTMFDIHTDTTIDTDWLMEKRGITPEQVIDLLTLTGDSVDNIPGVKGIGPKTASALLQQYGSIDSLYEHLDEIKGKRKENLVAAREFLPTAKKLVTLDRDVDIPFNLEDARVGGIDAQTLRVLFKQMGFNRHVDELDRLIANGSGGVPQTTSGPTSTGGSVAKAAASKPADPQQPGLFDTGEPDASADAAPRPDLSRAEQYDYAAITTREQLDDLVATLKQQKLIAVDTETIGLGHKTQLCGICLAWRAGQGVYVPVRSPEPGKHLDPTTVLDALRPVLEDDALPKCGHNLKYDLLVLRHAGVQLRGVAFDSMVGAYLLNKPGLGMDHLALAELQHETIPISQLIGAKGRGKTQKTMDQVPLDVITPYAAEDADLSLRLAEKMRPELDELGMSALLDTIETPLVSVLAEMEHHGVLVNPAVLDEQRKKLDERIIELRDAIHDAAGEPFNIDSPKQLAEVLFTKLKLPVGKRTKTGPSTDVEVLEKLCDNEELTDEQRAVPKLMVEYRQLTKLVGTYLESLKEAIDEKSKRIHASFHQTGTTTGRLSSSGPNLQNIPIRTDIGRQIRKAFIADPDHVLLCADYSQIELRILAHLSNDEALIDAFEKDQDIHAAVAAQVFGVDLDAVTSEQRGHAKTINFGIVYGVTAYGLARRIENLDVDAAKTLIADYRARFTGIDRFLAECIAHAEQHGYVKTMLGRRRPIPQISSTNGNQRALGERLAINTVVQGSAADLIKQAMVNLHRRIERDKLPMRMLLQIHDELVLETPGSEAAAMGKIVREEMEQAMSLKVPLRVDLGQGANWFDAK